MGTPDRADVLFVRRVQEICAWCGPAFVVLLFGGWGLVGGFIPLIPASDSAAEVAAAYGDHVTLSRVGLILGLIGIACTVPFFTVLSLQMRRAERGLPILAILQLTSALIVTVVLIIPMLMFVVGVFRPDRDPALTQLMNDMSYLILILPWPPIIGQLIPLVAAIVRDRREEPVFPRWFAGFTAWVAFLLLPATFIAFFKSGVFAWTGLIGFWIPAAVFGIWYVVLTPLLLRAVRSEAEEALAALDATASPVPTS